MTNIFPFEIDKNKGEVLLLLCGSWKGWENFDGLEI